MKPFVSGSWLEERLGDGRLVIADVRWYLDGRSGAQAFELGHLPGAVYVDLDKDLAGPSKKGTGRHPLPKPADFAAAMSRLGISRKSRVIAYDDAGGVMAARLVWMLRALGVRAALLDGGITAWNGAWESGPADEPKPATFEPGRWPAKLLAQLDELGEAKVILDARPADRYAGEAPDLDARSGHIPGAVNVPCRENVDDRGLLLDKERLRERFAGAGVTPKRVARGKVVSSCGSGVTACHNLLVMEQLGFGAARLYPGSWSQYAATDLPIVGGPKPHG